MERWPNLGPLIFAIVIACAVIVFVRLVSLIGSDDYNHSYTADQAPYNQPKDDGGDGIAMWDWLAAFWSWVTHDPVGFFTFALFCATAVLAVIGVVQIAFLIRAERAARMATIAANRPWVFTQPWPNTAQVLVNEEIHFEMEFHCYGNSPATVIELCVECSDTNPTGKPHYTTTATPRNIGLAPGNRWWEKDVDGAPFKTTWQQPYVFGFIRYQDQFGVHTSGFCVRLLPYNRKDPKDPWVAIATAGTPAWSHFD
jgi:hypothetical protein